MSRSRRVWVYTAAVTATLGIALAWFIALLTAAVLAAVAVAGVWAVLSLRPVIPPLARIVTIAAIAATVTAATVGLIAGAGALGLAMAGLLAVTAPPTITKARILRLRLASGYKAPQPPIDHENRGREPASSQPSSQLSFAAAGFTAPAVWDPAAVSAMTDQQLCRAWQASYLALQRQPLSDHPVIASFRAAVLDELRARQPGAFNRWMNDGARAASNPARYLTTSPAPADKPTPNSGQPDL